MLLLSVKKCKVNKDDLFKLLVDNKYYLASSGKKRISVIKYHDAAEEILQEISKRKITYTEISNKYSIDSTKFVQYCKTYYPVTNKFDETIFDSIDTEEKAYWLGFIFADGYISSSPLKEDNYTQYEFECSLQKDDYEHLEKMRNFFKLRNNIGVDERRCRLQVSSKHLWNVLNNYGCTPRKSLTLKFSDESIFKETYKYSKKTLLIHFIRGYWDGNGCLTYKRTGYPTITCVSTEDFLNGIQKVFNTNKNVYNNETNGNIITKVIKYNGKEAFKLASLMYKNAEIYLNRRHKKYLEYCRVLGQPSI